MPEITPANVTSSAWLKAKVPLSTTSPRIEPVVPPLTELQRAAGNRRAAGVGVGARQDQRAGPGLGQATPTGHGAAERDGVGAVEDQSAVVQTFPSTEPLVPPLPSCSVAPDLTVVPPLYC